MYTPPRSKIHHQLSQEPNGRTHTCIQKNLKKIFPNREQFPKELTKELSTKSDKIQTQELYREEPYSSIIKTSVEMSEMKEDAEMKSMSASINWILEGSLQRQSIRMIVKVQMQDSHEIMVFRTILRFRLDSGTKFAFVWGITFVLKWDSEARHSSYSWGIPPKCTCWIFQTDPRICWCQEEMMGYFVGCWEGCSSVEREDRKG